MPTPKELFLQSQKSLQLADFSDCSDDEKAAYIKNAYELASQAARLLRDRMDAEPTRSVLYRSSAALAIRCKLYREAERLACEGLAGTPPDVLRQELMDELHSATCHTYLEDKQIHIPDGGMLLSLKSLRLAPGLIEPREFRTRLDAVGRLTVRTGEKLHEMAFRKRGPVCKSIAEKTRFLFRTPIAASFAVELVFPVTEGNLFDHIDSDAILDSMLESLELFEADDVAMLQRHFADDEYFVNFIALASELAPDGKVIGSVGLFKRSGKKTRSLMLQRRPNQRRLGGTSEGETIVEFEGLLRTADVTEQRTDARRNIIKVHFENGAKSPPVEVPDAYMDDIVRPLWSRMVHLSAVKDSIGNHRFVAIKELE